MLKRLYYLFAASWLILMAWVISVEQPHGNAELIYIAVGLVPIWLPWLLAPVARWVLSGEQPAILVALRRQR